MSDPTTQDMLNNQNVTCPVILTDNSNNQVQGAQLDANSLTAEVSDTSVISVTIADDQDSIAIMAEGPVGNVTVTLNGTVNSVAMQPGIVTVVVGAAATSITIIPGTPVQND